MSAQALAESERVARAVTEALGGRGLFGVELFVKGDQVWFSEVSPRPHDTGLVTLISQDLSEFALHARAILGLPIPVIRQLGPSASAVILVEGKSRQVAFANLGAALSEADTALRLFGKPEVDGQRRMGVALARDESIDAARAKAPRRFASNSEMRRLATLAWWAAALPLLPLAVPLAIRTRRRALRLAPAAGPREGLVGGSGAEEPLRLLLFGESTVAGVGASCLDYALAGRLAAALGERLRRPVAWQALGENGITSGEARERLLPQVAGRFFDQVILVFGVNDTTSLRSLERWRADCAALIDGFQAAGAQVTCTAVPPLRHFSALPGLLRALLGWRGRLLDEALRDLAGATGAGYCPISLDLLPDYLAIDGFHPSQLGYQVWAGALADWLAAREKGGAAVA